MIQFQYMRAGRRIGYQAKEVNDNIISQYNDSYRSSVIKKTFTLQNNPYEFRTPYINIEHKTLGQHNIDCSNRNQLMQLGEKTSTRNIAMFA